MRHRALISVRAWNTTFAPNACQTQLDFCGHDAGLICLCTACVTVFSECWKWLAALAQRYVRMRCICWKQCFAFFPERLCLLCVCCGCWCFLRKVHDKSYFLCCDGQSDCRLLSPEILLINDRGLEQWFLAWLGNASPGAVKKFLGVIELSRALQH